MAGSVFHGWCLRSALATAAATALLLAGTAPVQAQRYDDGDGAYHEDYRESYYEDYRESYYEDWRDPYPGEYDGLGFGARERLEGLRDPFDRSDVDRGIDPEIDYWDFYDYDPLGGEGIYDYEL